MPLKSNNKFFKSFIIFSIIFYTLFTFWYNTNFYITTWGGIKVTSSFIFESTYWLKRNSFWQKSLDNIKTIKNQELRALLLKIYNNTIPVHQYWSSMITYKFDVINELINYYQSTQNWTSLQKISNELIKINPTNGLGWYNLGLSFQKLNQIQSATKAYQKTISINNVNTSAIKNLANIYISEGKYYKAYQLIEPYFNQISNPTKICIYWAENNFNSTNQKCSQNKIDNKYFSIPINSDLNNYMLRIDTPPKDFELQKIELTSITGNIKTITNFDKWTLHQLVKNKNNFISIGNDPYLYTTLLNTDLSNFNNIKIYINLEKSQKIDPELQNLIFKIEKHIFTKL